MTLNAFTKNKSVDLLMYAKGHVIHVTFSSVIKNGLLTVENSKDNKMISHKIITNTNYTHITVPHTIIKAKVTIVSEQVNYQKNITF